MAITGLISIIFGGMILGLQSSTNGRLSQRIGALETALVNFVGGAILLTFWLLFTRHGEILRIFTVPKWQLLGVFFGTGYLVLMTLAVPKIGVVAANITAISGQILASFIIDNFGFLGSNIIAFGLKRGIATILLILAMTALYQDQKPSSVLDKPKTKNPFFYLLALLSGSFLSIEGTMYGELGKSIGQFESSFYNFFIGSLLLTVLVLLFGKGSFNGIRKSSNWYLIGGLYGVIYLTSLVFGIPALGVGIAMIAIVLGQIVMSMLIETFGWFETPRQPLTLAKILTLIFLLIALTLIY